MERRSKGEPEKAALFALAAAVLYACSVPLSKQLLLFISTFSNRVCTSSDLSVQFLNLLPNIIPIQFFTDNSQLFFIICDGFFLLAN